MIMQMVPALLSRFAEDLVAHFAWSEEAARAEGIQFERATSRASQDYRLRPGEGGRGQSGECNIPALMVFMERCFETHVVQYDLKLGHDLQAAHAPR